MTYEIVLNCLSQMGSEISLILNLAGVGCLCLDFSLNVSLSLPFPVSVCPLYFYRKDTEPLYNYYFMYSLVSLLSGIYPLPVVHSLLVTLGTS